jgi:hypothetical protein
MVCIGISQMELKHPKTRYTQILHAPDFVVCKGSFHPLHNCKKNSSNPTWNICLVPTGVPLMKTVVSRVMLAWKKPTRSMPVSLRVVGGPSMLSPPFGRVRTPFVQTELVSSLVVISSNTSPKVNLLCLEKL